MRRLVALLTLVALVLSGAPARAAFRMAARQKQCCCAPAPSSAVCARSCCERGSEHSSAVDPGRLDRELVSVALPGTGPRLEAPVPVLPSTTPGAAWWIALHERARPRLPLRI